MLYHAPRVWVFLLRSLHPPSLALCVPSVLFGVFGFFPRDMLINSEFPALSELNQKWWIQCRAEQLNC